MDPLIHALRTCAFCPNTCRQHAPPELGALPESHTPSALALVALARCEGRLPADDATHGLLRQRRLLQALQPHCQYGLDIAGLLDQVIVAGGAP